MFYEGSLQEAIQSAVQQSKLVVCFVTDEEPTSIRWEAEYLTDEAIKDKLAQNAVVLRLVAGTEEAGFLEALFPIPRKPTLVMIQNGQLKEYIAPNVTKEIFLERAKKALDSTSPAAATSSPAGAQTSQPAAQASTTAQTPTRTPSAATRQLQGGDNGDDDDIDSHLYVDSSVPPGTNSASSSTSANFARQAAQNQVILAERAKRLEADKKARDAKDKAQRDARAKSRKPSADSGGANSSSSASPNQEDASHEQHQQRNIKPAERKHAQEVRQQKIQDREHRQKILKRIEDDRRERKEKDAQERQARLLLNATDESNNRDFDAAVAAAVPLTTRLTESSSSSGGKGSGKPVAHCNLQVRLFDGSTIRARFPSDSKLGKDVRTWIDEERTDGDSPYTFRIVLTPLPNKAVTSAEETESSLEALGLAPSATLVLVPVSFAAAYHANPRGDILGRALWPIIMLFRSGFSTIMGILRSLFGGVGARGDPAVATRHMGDTTNDNSDADEPPAASSRMRDTGGGDDGGDMRERKGKKKKGKKDEDGETNLYNGNSLSFEPRKDSDDEDDE